MKRIAIIIGLILLLNPAIACEKKYTSQGIVYICNNYYKIVEYDIPFQEIVRRCIQDGGVWQNGCKCPEGMRWYGWSIGCANAKYRPEELCFSTGGTWKYDSVKQMYYCLCPGGKWDKMVGCRYITKVEPQTDIISQIINFIKQLLSW